MFKHANTKTMIGGDLLYKLPEIHTPYQEETLKRNWSFATNFDFLILLSLQPNNIDL